MFVNFFSTRSGKSIIVGKYLYHFFLKVFHGFDFIQNLKIPLNAYPRFVEFGCGGSRKEGWLSVDYRLGADLSLDIRQRLPLPSNYFQKVFLEHVLEHFCHSELIQVLSNIYRIMTPDAELIISVPDLDYYVHEYLSGKVNNELLAHTPAVISKCPADLLNYIFYMDGEHKLMFNFDSLSYHLQFVGFRSVHMRDPIQGLDDPGRIKESLLVRCLK